MVGNFLSLSQHAKDRAVQARDRKQVIMNKRSSATNTKSRRRSSVLNSLGKFLNDDETPAVPVVDDHTEATFQQSFSSSDASTIYAYHHNNSKQKKQQQQHTTKSSEE